MAKPNKKQRFTRMQAIALHAEANKSDPFAAKRIAMTMARDGYKETQEIAKESKRILDARDAAVAKAFAAWKESEQRKAVLGSIGDALATNYAPSMSQFVTRADYDAAVAA